MPRLMTLALSLGLLLPACGGDDSGDGGSGETGGSAGSSSGGASEGGASEGGAPVGGASEGGTSEGGSSSGGAPVGGSSTGGSPSTELVTVACESSSGSEHNCNENSLPAVGAASFLDACNSSGSVGHDACPEGADAICRIESTSFATPNALFWYGLDAEGIEEARGDCAALSGAFSEP